MQQSFLCIHTYRNFMKKSVYIVLLLLLGIAIPTFAQLKVTLNMSSKPDPYLSNWAERKETVIVTVINSGSSSIRGKFDCKINKDGSLIVNTKPEKMKILDIPSGVSQYYGEELVPFEAAKIKDGADQTAIKTGMLPAGSYEFCCALLDPQDKQLTAPVCKSFTLQSYQAPVLLQPEDKSILAQNKRPIFRWSGVSPKPQFAIKYRLQVFEVLPGQTPINAFRANRPILDRTDIMATQYLWPADVEMPSPKLKHIWTVRALDDKDNSIGEPYGYATPFVIEPCCLKYGDVCCPPDDVTDNGGGNNFKDKGTGSGTGTGTANGTGSGTGTGTGSLTSSDKGSDISTNKRIPIAGTSGKGLGTSKRDSISGDSKLVSFEKAAKINNSHVRNSILSSFISMPEGIGFAFNPADEFTIKTKKGSEKYTAVKKEQYEAACKAKVSYMIPQGFAVGVPDPKTFQPNDPSVALFWKLYQNEQGAYVGFPLSLFLSPNGDKQINAAMRKNDGGNNDATCKPFVYRMLPLDMSSMPDLGIVDDDIQISVQPHYYIDEWNCVVRKSNFVKLPDITNDSSNPNDTTALLYDAGDVAGYAVEIIGTTDPVVLDDKTVSKNYVDGFGMVVVERDFKISTEEASALLSGLFAQSKAVKPSIKLTTVKREPNESEPITLLTLDKSVVSSDTKSGSVGLAYCVMEDANGKLYGVPVPLIDGIIPADSAKKEGISVQTNVEIVSESITALKSLFSRNSLVEGALLEIDGSSTKITSKTLTQEGDIYITQVGSTNSDPLGKITGTTCVCWSKYGLLIFTNTSKYSCAELCAKLVKIRAGMDKYSRNIQPDGSNDSDLKNPSRKKAQYSVTPNSGVGITVSICCITTQEPQSIKISNTNIANAIQQEEKIAQKVVIKEIVPNSDPENPSLSIVYTTADGKSNTILFDIIGLDDDPNISAAVNPVPGVGIIIKKGPTGVLNYKIPGIKYCPFCLTDFDISEASFNQHVAECRKDTNNPKMHYTKPDGTLKYFEYKEDYVVTDRKVCEALGVKELIIAAGVYKVEYPDPSKGGVVQFKLKTPIPAKQIKIKGTFTVEGTNPKGYNCEGPGNSCFFYSDTSSGEKKSPRDSCIFTIAPLMPDSTCLVIEVSFKGTGSPKAEGF